MRRYIVIVITTFVISFLCYLVVDLIFDSASAAIGSFTFSGLTSLVLFSAYNSDELKRGR